MQDLVIILPTHNRHDYLGSKIKYYADCGYEVYICDSTSNKFEYNKQMPVNISQFVFRSVEQPKITRNIQA